MSALASELSGYAFVPEPELRFAGEGLGKHPLMGLIQHGPYGLRYGSPNALRLALLAPARDFGKLRGLVAEFERSAKPKEATNYYPEYPGFNSLFRIPIAREDGRLVIPFPDALDDYARDGNKQRLAAELFQCIARLRLLRSSFDVALIYLPPSWAACFEGENFNFHDYLTGC